VDFQILPLLKLLAEFEGVEPLFSPASKAGIPMTAPIHMAATRLTREQSSAHSSADLLGKKISVVMFEGTGHIRPWCSVRLQPINSPYRKHFIHRLIIVRKQR